MLTAAQANTTYKQSRDKLGDDEAFWAKQRRKRNEWLLERIEAKVQETSNNGACFFVGAVNHAKRSLEQGGPVNYREEEWPRSPVESLTNLKKLATDVQMFAMRERW